jgi:hypothetical protein
MKRTAVLTALAATILGGSAALFSVLPAAAQSPAGTVVCLPGAPEITTTSTSRISSSEPSEVDFRTATIEIGQPVTVTTTYNYKNVEGLLLVVRQTAGTRTENVIAPRWLLDAYGGNLGAIQADLSAGRLKDRGPCVAA